MNNKKPSEEQLKDRQYQAYLKQKRIQEDIDREEFLRDVKFRELKARANKAEFEQMYFYLEAKKIEPVFLEAVKQDRAEKEKAYEERIAAEKEIMQRIKDSGGEILSAEPVSEIVDSEDNGKAVFEVVAEQDAALELSEQPIDMEAAFAEARKKVGLN